MCINCRENNQTAGGARWQVVPYEWDYPTPYSDYCPDYYYPLTPPCPSLVRYEYKCRVSSCGKVNVRHEHCLRVVCDLCGKEFVPAWVF